VSEEDGGTGVSVEQVLGVGMDHLECGGRC